MVNINEGSGKIIQFISNTLKKVNDKIDDLLECSIKDFVLLNSLFKKYHDQLKSFSTSTSNFLSMITSSKEDITITQQSKKAKQLIVTLKESANKQLSNHKNQSNQYNLILLNISNLKQDISTLRLLFTNLRFDPSIKTNPTNINKYLNNLSDCFEACEKIANKLCLKLREIIDYSENRLRNKIDSYIDLTDKINEQTAVINNIRGKAINYEKQIQKIEQTKVSSTSEIITNLQFQDILRQKIEHIQEACSEITQSLLSSHKEGAPLNPEELFKIHDICSLQSAQLVHANQEYQNAIETILQRINILNQLVNSYNSIRNHFCKPEQSKLQNTTSKLNEEITLLNTQSFSLNQITKKYHRLLEELSKNKIEFHSSLDSAVCRHKEIYELKAIIDNTELLKDNVQKYSPVLQLRNELIKFENDFKKLNIILNELENTNNNKEQQIIKESELKIELLNDFSSKTTKLFNNYINNNKLEIINSTKFETSTDFVIEQVAYYKTFEKEVEKIIYLLDGLLEEINLNKYEVDEKRLNYLKNMYTMQSEKNIHEALIKKEKNKLDKDDKDNDIEFF